MAESSSISEISTLLSLASGNSQKDERTLNEYSVYSEDFHTSESESDENVHASLLKNVVVVDHDELLINDELSEFFTKKIDILKRNKVCNANGAKDNACTELNEKLSPIWLEKMANMKIVAKIDVKEAKRHDNELCSCSENERLPGKENRKLRKEQVEDDIDCFQPAYERLKFENLRFKSRKFIKSELHFPQKCETCQGRRQKVEESDFYKKRLQTVQNKEIDKRYEQFLQNNTSALLIGKIIEDGPCPRWKSHELWQRLALSQGSYMHPGANKQTS